MTVGPAWTGRQGQNSLPSSDRETRPLGAPSASDRKRTLLPAVSRSQPRANSQAKGAASRPAAAAAPSAPSCSPWEAASSGGLRRVKAGRPAANFKEPALKKSQLSRRGHYDLPVAHTRAAGEGAALREGADEAAAAASC